MSYADVQDWLETELPRIGLDGISFVRVEGTWKGTPENSFVLVFTAGPEDRQQMEQLVLIASERIATHGLMLMKL